MEGICLDLARRLYPVYLGAGTKPVTPDESKVIADAEEMIHEAMYRARFCTCPCRPAEEGDQT